MYYKHMHLTYAR